MASRDSAERPGWASQPEWLVPRGRYIPRVPSPSPQFRVTKFILRSFDWLNIPKNHDNIRTVLKAMAVINRHWYRLRCLVIVSPEKKVQKEAENLLAQLQEAREKPQFVIFNKEGRRLMRAHEELLDKLEGMGGAWANDDENERKMSETISAIMHHMVALLEQNESFRGSQGTKARLQGRRQNPRQPSPRQN